MAQVTADLMKRLGLNVEYASMDWGTLVSRRTSKEPPEKGGWNAFCTTYEGLTVADPATHIPCAATAPTPGSAGPPARGWRICATSGSTRPTPPRRSASPTRCR